MQAQIAKAAKDVRAPIFYPAPVNDTETDPLDALGTVVTIATGAELYGEGDRAEHWYRVRSGIVRTSKLLPDGRRQIDDFLFPGDFFGLEIGATRSLTAEAVNGASVVRYARARFDGEAPTDSRLSARLLNITLGRLGKAHERLLTLGRKTAEERVASFLLEMLDRAPSAGAIELAMSRTDIADYLGLTIETVSRTFSALKRDRVIALANAHRVTIVDLAALETLSGDL